MRKPSTKHDGQASSLQAGNAAHAARTHPMLRTAGCGGACFFGGVRDMKEKQLRDEAHGAAQPSVPQEKSCHVVMH